MADVILATNLDTPLMIAARNGDEVKVKELIAAGANVDELDRDNRTAFIHASISSEFVTAKLLLNAGADINARDSLGRTAAHYTVLGRSTGRSARFLQQLLVKRRADFTIRDSDGFTPLMLTAKSGYFQFIKNGRPDLTEILIKAGVDINAWNTSGWNALMIAAVDGNLTVCELLINAGIDVNFINSAGTSALMIGAEKGNFDLCAKLVSAGADVNYCNVVGLNALILAVKDNNEKVCELLIKHGAGPLRPTDDDCASTLDAAPTPKLRAFLLSMFEDRYFLGISAEEYKKAAASKAIVKPVVKSKWARL